MLKCFHSKVKKADPKHKHTIRSPFAELPEFERRPPSLKGIFTGLKIKTVLPPADKGNLCNYFRLLCQANSLSLVNVAVAGSEREEGALTLRKHECSAVVLISG